jgi:glycosyltransferase involved in cell wall biosynthesis
MHGAPARIVPTERFDEAFYRSKYLDMAQSPTWLFEHFIRNGVFEGRLPNHAPAFYRPPNILGCGEPDLPYLYKLWHAADFPGEDGIFAKQAAFRQEVGLQKFLSSAALKLAFVEAQSIDPTVGEIGSITEFLLPPFNDIMAPVEAEIRRRIPAVHYESLICVPWIRTGGADLVAGLLAAALQRIRPNEKILILRTDNPHFERANWIPPGVDVVDISDVIASLSVSDAEIQLRFIFRGLRPKRVFNVNSRLCWTTFRSYGRNLASTFRLYAYLFCWDQTESGVRAGYPAEFFAETAGSMGAFLTDTDYLKVELQRMYSLPASACSRIVPMFTPAQAMLRNPSVARDVFEKRDGRSKRTVLWAGRLDRQKRFDLVQEIACLMPQVEFHCWGAALLDAPPDLSRLPPNIKMRGSFDSFDELPLTEAGAWLFTALWEGMPTTLIELAARGVAIVASAVGGVPELIQPDTGWPLPPGADAAEYCAALQHALDMPEEAMSRAEALQRRMAARYTEANYDAALSSLVMQE